MEESKELSSLLKCLNVGNPDRMVAKDDAIDLLKDSIADEKAQIVANVIFTAFDKDVAGTINLEELMMATNCISSNNTMLVAGGESALGVPDV